MQEVLSQSVESAVVEPASGSFVCRPLMMDSSAEEVADFLLPLLVHSVWTVPLRTTLIWLCTVAAGNKYSFKVLELLIRVMERWSFVVNNLNRVLMCFLST